MFERILVVCEGNICRSPVGEFMLREHLPGRDISSAGLSGLEGHDMDPVMREIALENGLDCPTHVARRLKPSMCRRAELILVMERQQRERIGRATPEALGKVLLMGKWLDEETEIPDPFRRERDHYERAYRQLDSAARAWSRQLTWGGQ